MKKRAITILTILGGILTIFLVTLPTAAQSSSPFKLTSEVGSSGEEGGSGGAVPSAITAVMWDQPSNFTGGIASQYLPDYSTGFFSADDFENAEDWELDLIFIDGAWNWVGSLPDADSLHWYIYADAGGVPAGHPLDGGGTEFWSYVSAPTDPGVTLSGDYADNVTLDITAAQGSTISLPPGHYWLVFFPSLEHTSYSQWWWEKAGSMNLVDAHLIDPDNLFGAGFTTWTSWYNVVEPGGTYDLAFRLEGDAITEDWGDAPDPQFPTLAANNGARHTLTGPTLGVNRDGEVDGQPTANADGDDVNGTPDDEDGISFVGAIAASEGISKTASINLDLQNPDGTQNRLDAWLDFNADGDWNDPGEQIFTNYDLGTTTGLQALTFTVPQILGGNVVIGTTYARFRLSTAGGLLPAGLAADGEVEDYQVSIVNVGELQCGIAAATYTFNTQSGVIIDVDNPGTDLACLYVEEHAEDHPNASDGLRTGKYWTIKALQSDHLTPATEDFTLTLTLPHSLGTSHANAKVCKYPGTQGGYGWDCFRNGSDESMVWLNGIQSLSDWAVGDQVGPTALRLNNLKTQTSSGSSPAIILISLLFVSIGGVLLRQRAHR